MKKQIFSGLYVTVFAVLAVLLLGSRSTTAPADKDGKVCFRLVKTVYWDELVAALPTETNGDKFQAGVFKLRYQQWTDGFMIVQKTDGFTTKLRPELDKNIFSNTYTMFADKRRATTTAVNQISKVKYLFEATWSAPPPQWCVGEDVEFTLTSRAVNPMPELGNGPYAAISMETTFSTKQIKTTEYNPFANAGVQSGGGRGWEKRQSGEGKTTLRLVDAGSATKYVIGVRMQDQTNNAVFYIYERGAGPTPAPPPPSGGSPKTFAGNWSNSWGKIVFRVNGNQLTGEMDNFAGKHGTAAITGTVTDRTVKGKWKAARASGRITLTATDNWSNFHTTFTEDDPLGPGGAITCRRAANTGPITTLLPKPTVMTLLAEKRKVKKGDLVLVPVWLYKADDVASLDFTVAYDPQAAVPEGKAIPGNLLSGLRLSVNPNQAGLIRISVGGASGMKGEGQVVFLPFRVIGAPGSFTPLHLEVTTAAGAKQQKRVVAVADGEIRIYRGDGSDRLKGDCNGDGVLDGRDAQCALDMSTKLIPQDLVLDMDNNGTVNAIDATLILQSRRAALLSD